MIAKVTWRRSHGVTEIEEGLFEAGAIIFDNGDELMIDEVINDRRFVEMTITND